MLGSLARTFFGSPMTAGKPLMGAVPKDQRPGAPLPAMSDPVAASPLLPRAAGQGRSLDDLLPEAFGGSGSAKRTWASVISRAAGGPAGDAQGNISR